MLTFLLSVFAMTVIIVLLMLARNEVVYSARTKAIGYATKYGWAEFDKFTYDEMMYTQLTKWTFEQLYPGYAKRVGK